MTHNLEYWKAYHQRRMEEDPEFRDYRQLKSFELSLEYYFGLLENQNGLCAICKGHPNGQGWLHIDHNHETGQVRELLCPSCSLALGLIKEDVQILENMIQYIKKHDILGGTL